MKRMLACLWLGLVAVGTIHAAEPPEGFRPLLNGQDLSGWVLVNTPPATWSVEDGLLVCSGRPIGEIRTDRMYQNFILDLEWRHLQPRGNAGIFVWADDITARGVPFHRSVEVQVLENAYGSSRGHTTHGDIFPIHGATMTPINGRGGSRAFPSEERSRPSPEWNHYQITCQDGAISLAVNGKVVTRGTDASPRKGYICLESEGGVVHYRNIFIRELPETPLAAEHVAVANRGFRSLYTGLDLSGWSSSDQGLPHWHVKDWILSFDGKVGADAAVLASDETFGDCGFLFDIRFQEGFRKAQIALRGSESSSFTLDPSDPQWAKHLEPAGRWNRVEGTVDKERLSLRVNGQPVLADQPVSSKPGAWKFALDGAADLANIFVRPLHP